jgi:serine/threonine protein kinase
MLKPNTWLGKYLIEKELGVGSFATVYLCTTQTDLNKTTSSFAVKVAKRNTESHLLLSRGQKILQSIHSNSAGEEIDIGKRYIVEFVDIVETSDHYGIVLELIPGIELFDYVMANHRVVDDVALGLEEVVSKQITKQLLQGTIS